MKNHFSKSKISLLVVVLACFILTTGFSFINEGANTFTCAYHHQNQLMTDHLEYDYEKAWKKITELELQGLPKSALEKVEELLTNARSEAAHSQFIKGLLFKGKYESQLEEDGFANAIFKMQEEMESASFPVKPILQSMLAEMYTKYLDQNRWQFQNRTETVDFKNDDIRTWTMERLLSQSAEYYWASIENKRSQGIEIKDFELILEGGSNDEGLRPTLYDFLAQRAIDHFMNERNYLTQPAYKFEIENEKAFAPVREFVEWKIVSKDTSSQKLQTLQLFQELLSFRATEKIKFSPSLLDADLKRLKFVHNNSVNTEKDESYLNALEQLKKQYEGSQYIAEVNYALAQYYHNKGVGYQPPAFGEKDLDERKWLIKKAHDLCKTTYDKYPKTVGTSNCIGLLQQITQQELTLQTEQVNLPKQPFLAHINYRNLKTAYFKILPFDQNKWKELEELRQGGNWNKKAIQYLNKLTPEQTWSVELPDDGDFHRHATEIKIDALPLGLYVVMASSDEQFKGEGNQVGYFITHVSNLGYWERKLDNRESEFIVFNRNTGAPIHGASVEFWTRSYNSVFRKYDVKKKGDLVTNADGFIKSPLRDKNSRNFTIRIKYGNDELDTRHSFYNNFHNNQPKPYQRTEFFLDRAIYRPGQTVYFKGVALNFDTKRMPTILKNQLVTVTFRDANRQEAGKLELQTNEYGTFSGQFVAPKGGLLGNMQLRSSIGNSSKNFKVEEYKRPKFEVKFEPITSSFRINDEVKITGKATAFAGNQIDGANVKWRVVRQTTFPWYWRSWRWNPWRNETMEIGHGTATTNEKGEFEVNFKAIPNKKIPAENKPQFNYTVYADVTDITGETRSSQTIVKVGYIAMQADVPIAQSLHADSLRGFDLVTQNLNGEYEAAKGTFKIEKLKAPNQIFINRYWGNKIDRRTMSEADFKKAFPQFAWNNENLPEQWTPEKTILEEDFDTETSKKIGLPKYKMMPGSYVITLKTQDKYGEAVELKKYFSLFDFTKKGLPSPTALWHHFDNRNYEPNEEAEMYFASSHKQQPVLLEFEKDGRPLGRKWLTINELQTETHKVKESDRGHVQYYYSYAGMNRSSNNSKFIAVPWSNKDLTIEYGTFRDKLSPGQEEEWVIKIKGPKGEKVASEMVAGMYDASLDAFAPNNWGMNLFPQSHARVHYMGPTFSTTNLQQLEYFRNKYNQVKRIGRSYDRLNWFNWHLGGHYYKQHNLAFSKMEMESTAMANAPRREMRRMKSRAAGVASDMDEVNITGSRDGATEYYVDGVAVSGNAADIQENNSDDALPPPSDLSQVQVRTNLNETVFFFPHLMTNKDGDVLVKFKMNEALTKWKFLGMAHTQDLETAITTKEVITQKELMVVPNPPRFFREFDEIEFSAKVVNLTEKTLTGNAELQLINPMNAVPVYKWLDNPQFNQNFTVEGGQSAHLAWRFNVPNVADVPVIEHTVLAVAGDYSDGERSAAPVLSNRMLVTETKPLPVRGQETKEFVFESLTNNNSSTLRHQGMTLEFTQNPAWYAVQALPYLMEYPHECTEQIFSRYYANTLATSVANAHPKIKMVFEKWRDFTPPSGEAGGGDALLSNLSKNQELKTALLEETPWVLQAQSEELQKQNIGLLFDLNRMAYEQEVTLRKLQERQMPGGGWAWFPGGRDSWYITQYLVEGFGHLHKLNVDDITENAATWQMVEKAVAYCDARIVEEYERLERRVKRGEAKWENDHLSYLASHYLYARSFFLQDQSAQANTGESVSGKQKHYIALKGKAQKVHDYYMGQAKKFWLKKGIYTEGMLSLAMFRNGDVEAANKVVRSLKEHSLNHDELGMYWKYPRGWYWYQAPIETHSLMIEAFGEITNDEKVIDDLKVWLLKNKQTNHWKTTKATANAVYALLSSGDNWLLDDAPLDISFGKNANDSRAWNKTIADSQQKAEAGTGYFKVRFDGEEVNKGMGHISITNPNNVVAWGAMYWQYFEDLDNITTFEETPLTINKQLFRVENSDRGEIIKPINEGDKMKVGEKLKVRIEIRVDRDMEYVHMKDMRASGFEPINVLSQYKWQDGLGYYESTRDASTNFFFSFLPKGTYVFEYPLRVQHNGDFSNGITTMQCMYAPEFTSHSKGVRVLVEE